MGRAAGGQPPWPLEPERVARRREDDGRGHGGERLHDRSRDQRTSVSSADERGGEVNGMEAVILVVETSATAVEETKKKTKSKE